MLDQNRISDIRQRLLAAESRVERKIHERDNMFAPGQASGYLGIGKRALHEVACALIMSPETGYKSIMDFPSGWGRVARWLRAAFPESELAVSDIIPGAADWCGETFGANVYQSDSNFDRIELGRTFDIFWVGSLITHLPEDSTRAFLRFAMRHINEQGLLIITVHGRRAVANGRKQRVLTVFPKPEDMEAAALAYESGQYSYRDYSHTPGYGHSFTPLAWIERNLPEGSLVFGYKEKGWNNHQDVLILKKAAI